METPLTLSNMTIKSRNYIFSMSFCAISWSYNLKYSVCRKCNYGNLPLKKKTSFSFTMNRNNQPHFQLPMAFMGTSHVPAHPWTHGLLRVVTLKQLSSFLSSFKPLVHSPRAPQKCKLMMEITLFAKLCNLELKNHCFSSWVLACTKCRNSFPKEKKWATVPNAAERSRKKKAENWLLNLATWRYLGTLTRGGSVIWLDWVSWGPRRKELDAVNIFSSLEEFGYKGEQEIGWDI